MCGRKRLAIEQKHPSTETKGRGDAAHHTDQTGLLPKFMSVRLSIKFTIAVARKLFTIASAQCESRKLWTFQTAGDIQLLEMKNIELRHSP